VVPQKEEKTMKNILISPKHRLNPTIPVCFWCGKDKNEIVLAGRVTTKEDNDYKMPMHCVLDYEPCDKCRAVFEQGVHIIEVTDKSGAKDGRPPISKDSDGSPVYPTGHNVVIVPEAAKRIFSLPGEQLEAGKSFALDAALFGRLLQMVGGGGNS